MYSNSFKNNTSSRSGGAIKWTDIEPVGIEDSSNSFSLNSAAIYGDNIASFPQKLTKQNSGRLLESTAATLNEQKSGSELDEFFV